MPDRHAYWDAFYAGRRSSAVPVAPSTFATWTSKWIRSSTSLVEFGFGNGRDALWFARRGVRVQGYDFAESAVELATVRSQEEGLNNARFEHLDLGDDAATKTLGQSIRADLEDPILYGRFLIHSLTDTERRNLFDLAALALERGGRLFLEFRTGKDRDQKHIFGDDHFRLFLDPATVEAEIEEVGGRIAHSEAGHGLSIYKTEDPHVARIIGEWGTASRSD